MHEGYTEEQKRELEQVDKIPDSDMAMYRMYKSKKFTYAEIGKYFKVNATTVMRHIDRIKELNGEIVLSRFCLVQKLREGMTPEDIAEECFCSVRTVYRKLEKYGVIVQQPRDNHGRFRSPFDNI